MEKHNEDRKHLVAFWKKNKDKCAEIRSIDAVYGVYLEYLKTIDVEQSINKYIFRTYIRKNGYCNSRAKELPNSVETHSVENTLNSKLKPTSHNTELQRDA